MNTKMVCKYKSAYRINLRSSFSFLTFSIANVKIEPIANVMPNVFQVTGYN